ncbi:MAG: hypothetical protein HRF52_14605 [Ignavibacterium sp.]|uniref:hypothetical protein n=1 Tax=Ignavibacterium sp. TaxID=2651167 RepID=UPI0032987854
MARIKNVEAFCTICGSVKKFEITGTIAGEENQNKRWAKCKTCKQTRIIDLADIKTETKPNLEGIETQNVKNYSPTETYEIGDNIYHKSWDDFGKVVNKVVTSDGQSSIIVEFQKSGNKKLIESYIQKPQSEVI